jgi:hypothetical protein
MLTQIKQGLLYLKKGLSQWEDLRMADNLSMPNTGDLN